MLCIALLGVCHATEEVPIPYTVQFRCTDHRGQDDGPDCTALHNDFAKVSKLYQNQASGVKNTTLLTQWTQEDEAALRQTLDNLGLFDVANDIKTEFQPGTPPAILVELKLHARYGLSDVVVQAPTPQIQQLAHDIMREQPALTGAPVDGAALADLVQVLRTQLANRGIYGATVDVPTLQLTHKTQQASAIFKISQGQVATFGNVRIVGLKSLDQAYVRNRVDWQTGDVYVAKKVAKLRTRLLSSGLFQHVDVTERCDADGHVHVTIDGTEGPHRSVTAGISYSTFDATGGKLGWEHQNLFGHGEQFEVGVKASKRQTRAYSSLIVPDFLAANQKLITYVAGFHEKSPAYTQRTVEANSRVQRSISEFFIASVGGALEGSRVRRRDTSRKSQRNQLVGIPVELLFDTTDDVLNATEGFRLNGKVLPWFGRLGEARHMTMIRIMGSGYLALGRSLIWANWIAQSQLIGPTLQQISPNKRLYAGGGRSVRGYGYQKLGPLESDGTPIGGKSMTEVGTEVRFNVTEAFQVATFVEGATVRRDTSTFDASPLARVRWLWGYGIGARYMTGVGPIRVDLAFPAHRRAKKVDSPFQIYASIGQAF